MRIPFFIVLATGLAAACAPASQQAVDVNAGSQGSLTAGSVQREIRVGMTGSEVVSALGSPNIVTGSPTGGETWIYDRISTQRVYSQNVGGVNALFLGGFSATTGASSTSQRTLTVIIQFDTAGRVRDFNYRQSSF